MEQKEIIQTLDAIKSEIANENKKAIEAVKDGAQKEANEIKERISDLQIAADANQKALDAIIAERKNIQAGIDKNKSINEQAADVIASHKDQLLAIKGDKYGKLNFNIKSAATMTVANYSGGTVGLSQWDPAFALVARRMPKIRQIVNSFPVTDRYVAWAEQSARDGGAGNTAEGTAKTQADFDIVEANKIVEKITAYTKVSKEALSDIKFLQREINNDLISLVEAKLDTDLYAGSGVTPIIKGIYTYATTFAAPSGLALAIESANELDALRAAMAQIENAFFSPSHIILHPTDVAKIDMLKAATTNEYLTHQAAGQFMFKSFYGLPIVSSTVVTQGTFLIGDFSKSNLGIKEEINIQVGYDGSDFTTNLVTILAEARAVHYIKSNHTTAFVKGTFSTVKAALETA